MRFTLTEERLWILKFVLIFVVAKVHVIHCVYLFTSYEEAKYEDGLSGKI